MKLCTASQMREFDRLIIEAGTPGTVLMERAGQHCADGVVKMLGEVAGRRILIVCGGGNNGGDGFVVARLLQSLQAKVQVVLLVSADGLQGDAKVNFARLDGIEPIVLLCEDDVASFDLHGDLVVDCLFGTGLSRPVTGRFGLMIQRINGSGRPVVAVVIPSGLDADTGQVLGQAVRADLTVTFQLQKLGLVQFPALDYVGEVLVVDIGLSKKYIEDAALASLLDHDRAVRLLPDRIQTGHKGSFGHVLVVAGSRGKTGAAILSSLGCLRAGAGLVSLCVPEKLNVIVESTLLEAMTIPVRGLDGLCFHNHDFVQILDAASGKGCVVVGPGLGQEPSTAQLLNQLLVNLTTPLVVDADGLNLLHEDSLESLAGRRVVLTPHPGEMALLTGKTVAEIQQDRVKVARGFAKQFEVVVVLKGAATVIAGPSGEVAINSSGNAGMATGGMGDVLSGIIATLLAQGMSAFAAACLGVYSHGRAGDLLNHDGAPYGYLASELADTLPDVWQELLAG